MEAEFFCMGGETSRAEFLQKLISTYLDPSIKLIIRDLESGSERYLQANRYQQLMQASIPPALGLSLSVTTMNWYQRRVYILIYWSIFTEGYRSELQGISSYYTGYEIRRWQMFFPDGEGLEFFLPALAIRDRMVLVPSGQSKLLKEEGSEKLADVKYDIQEVDFNDTSALDQALNSVARRLKQEISYELSAYRSFAPGAFDVEKAATELQLPPTLLVRALREEADAASVMYQMLSSELGHKTFTRGSWTKTTLTVRNGSDRDLRGLKVKISGPVDLLPRDINLNLSPNSHISVDVSIRPPDPGDFPLEIAFILPEDQVLEEWLPSQYIWVQSI